MPLKAKLSSDHHKNIYQAAESKGSLDAYIHICYRNKSLIYTYNNKIEMYMYVYEFDNNSDWQLLFALIEFKMLYLKTTDEVNVGKVKLVHLLMIKVNRRTTKSTELSTTKC